MFVYNRFFKRNIPTENIVNISISDIACETNKSTNIPNNTVNKNKLAYVVLDKNSLMPIGVFNSLLHAKVAGNKATYNNCIIYPYTMNMSCKYIVNSVYESA